MKTLRILALALTLLGACTVLSAQSPYKRTTDTPVYHFEAGFGNCIMVSGSSSVYAYHPIFLGYRFNPHWMLRGEYGHGGPVPKFTTDVTFFGLLSGVYTLPVSEHVELLGFLGGGVAGDKNLHRFTATFGADVRYLAGKHCYFGLTSKSFIGKDVLLGSCIGLNFGARF